jgi:hypothetical protein
VEIHILDSASVSGDDYALEFVSLPGSGGLGYDVSNQRTGQMVVVNAAVADRNTEGPYFDGLRLVVTSDRVAAIDSATAWAVGSSNLVMRATPDQAIPARDWPSPSDYDIVWYSTTVDSTLFGAPPRYPKVPLNFLVTNMTEGKQIHVIVDDADRSLSLSPDDTIRFIEKFVSASDFKLTWSLTYGKPKAGVPTLPVAGDRFVIRSTKPYLPGDSIIFSSEKVLLVRGFETELARELILSQNYPNPFNPVTTIRFSVPVRGAVTLKVIDVVGREVATLVNDVLKPGVYERQFDAAKLASGAYFYQIRAGGSVQTKKLVVLR